MLLHMGCLVIAGATTKHKNLSYGSANLNTAFISRRPFASPSVRWTSPSPFSKAKKERESEHLEGSISFCILTIELYNQKSPKGFPFYFLALEKGEGKCRQTKG